VRPGEGRDGVSMHSYQSGLMKFVGCVESGKDSVFAVDAVCIRVEVGALCGMGWNWMG
jgi:hypothetical protein